MCNKLFKVVVVSLRFRDLIAHKSHDQEQLYLLLLYFFHNRYLHENQLQSITENTFAGLFGISEL